jgi:surfactin synthase thioesterase subunit
MYLRWQRLLPAWVQLVPVELPGHGARIAEPCVESFEALVEKLCQEHAAVSNGPYALYGHSMGGLLAHGMIAHWRQQSRRLPEVLFASASPAPACRDPDYFADKSTDAKLIAELRKQDGTPREVFEDAEMLRITLDCLRADYRVCAGYRHRVAPPLPVPIHVFAGRRDDIEEARILAWESETSVRFSVQWFDGGHFFIRQHEATLLSALASDLQAVSRMVPHARAISA